MILFKAKLTSFRDQVILDKNLVKPLWSPIIDFDNVMHLEESKVIGRNKGGTLAYSSSNEFSKIRISLEKSRKNMIYAEALKVKFSCPFNFKNFPFDSNQCCLTYGDLAYGTNNVTLGTAKIFYDNMTTEDGPIIVNSLPFPFMVKITEKATFVKVDKFNKKKYSRSGMCMDLTRTSRGRLDSGYYYPMAAFALLSMISYLINPDIVSHAVYILKFYLSKLINSFWFQKVPGRMGMIVMLYLISTNVYNSVDDPTSKGFSYYIEIWMIGTQIPILLKVS